MACESKVEDTMLILVEEIFFIEILFFFIIKLKFYLRKKFFGMDEIKNYLW